LVDGFVIVDVFGVDCVVVFILDDVGIIVVVVVENVIAVVDFIVDEYFVGLTEILKSDFT